jgi:putative DNA primase/helicase
VARVGVIFGPPGQGKSTLLALMVADITRKGGRVLIASGDENDPATTLLPRMVAAGADVGLVDLMWTKATEGETELVLPRDIKALGRRMEHAAMLLIDPISAHFDDTINAWKEQEVRSQILAPLAYRARETGCAVPYVSHMNKSNGTDPLSRISGSGGFGAAARFALLLGSHPDDIGLPRSDQRLVLVHVKANESALQPAIVFRRRIVGVDGGGESHDAAVPILEIEDDRAQITAEEVLAHTDPDEAGAFTQAIDFLKGELSNGGKPSKRLLATARERGDFSERTLRKAKHALKVKSEREGNEWWWVRQ